MRKIYILLVAIVATFSVSAQTADSRLAIPFSFNLYHLNDFTYHFNNTPTFKGDYYKHTTIYDLGRSNYGGEVGLRYYLNPSFDLGLDLAYFVIKQTDKTGLGLLAYHRKFGSFDTDLALTYKFNNGYIIDEDAFFKPYIGAGLGVYYSADMDEAKGSKRDLPADKAHLTVPVSAGFRFKLSDGLDLNLGWKYKISTLKDRFDYLVTSIGFVWNINPNADSDDDGVLNKEDECPEVPGTIATKGCPDADGDGIADKDDNCPQVAGLAAFNGCPDTDGDGIMDSEDACPNAAGTKENKGCPDTDGDGIIDKNDNCPKKKGTKENGGCPDTDGDGVLDKDDKCPNEAGLKARQGCPVRDKDNDGVEDDQDRCPTIPGIKANKGCPEIKQEVKKILAQALAGVKFRSGSDVLYTSSYSKLNKVVEVMKNNPSYKLEISGHTDSSGNAAKNLDLSKRRAKAAMNYIIKKGISADRMTSEGYGITKPVADNKTAAGRAQNRRVEFKVVF